MNLSRWTVVSQSPFAWERDALDFARTHLPDHEPWRAWSNFEFIDDEGRVNEVDLLVLAPGGLVLIEIKSRPGTVVGDAHSWTWTTEGRQFTRDNPLPLANRKAKRLSAVLRRQDALSGRGGSRAVAPWVEPLIFLSDVKLPRQCCTEAGHGEAWTQYPQSACHLSDTDILRASERQHPVQGSGSDSSLGP
jgi:Nuclease-related domain